MFPSSLFPQQQQQQQQLQQQQQQLQLQQQQNSGFSVYNILNSASLEQQQQAVYLNGTQIDWQPHTNKLYPYKLSDVDSQAAYHAAALTSPEQTYNDFYMKSKQHFSIKSIFISMFGKNDFYCKKEPLEK